MDLVVAGAGPSYSTLPGALGAAYLVRWGDHALLLDFGHGTFSNVARAWEPSALEAVVISHLHPDHFIDLVALRHYLRYEFASPRRLRVLGPADLAARLDALHAEPGFAATTLDIQPIGGASTRAIGPFMVEWRPVSHTAESYGTRVSISGGAGLVYSGDCGRADDLAPLLRPGDTLLSECSYGPDPVPLGTLHLNSEAVGRLAAARSAGQVLLAHVHSSLDRSATVAAVRAWFDGPVRIVEPGDCIAPVA